MNFIMVFVYYLNLISMMLLIDTKIWSGYKMAVPSFVSEQKRNPSHLIVCVGAALPDAHCGKHAFSPDLLIIWAGIFRFYNSGKYKDLQKNLKEEWLIYRA